MIRKKRLLNFVVLLTLLLCSETKKKKKLIASLNKRYLRNGTGGGGGGGGYSHGGAGGAGSNFGSMFLDESLVHVGGSSYKSFGGSPRGDDSLEHEIDHLAGDDRDQPILGIGLQHGGHRTKFSGGGIDYNEFSQPNEMMMHSNGQQDFYTDKVHMNDMGHLTTNDPLLGSRGSRNRDLYAHTRNTADQGAGKFDAISQNTESQQHSSLNRVKQLLHHLRSADLTTAQDHRMGRNEGLLLQGHHKSHLHGNDTIHSPPDGSDAMFNTHSSPRHADDHEFIPKATDENYDAIQPSEGGGGGGCDDRERLQRRNCPNLIRIDKKIVRLPVASGHHSVRAHHYDNNDNGDDDDTEANTRNGGTALESDAPIPKKMRHNFSDPTDDSWMKDDGRNKVVRNLQRQKMVEQLRNAYLQPIHFNRSMSDNELGLGEIENSDNDYINGGLGALQDDMNYGNEYQMDGFAGRRGNGGILNSGKRLQYNQNGRNLNGGKKLQFIQNAANQRNRENNLVQNTIKSLFNQDKKMPQFSDISRKKEEEKHVEGDRRGSQQFVDVNHVNHMSIGSNKPHGEDYVDNAINEMIKSDKKRPRIFPDGRYENEEKEDRDMEGTHQYVDSKQIKEANSYNNDHRYLNKPHGESYVDSAINEMIKSDKKRPHIFPGERDNDNKDNRDNEGNNQYVDSKQIKEANSKGNGKWGYRDSGQDYVDKEMQYILGPKSKGGETGSRNSNLLTFNDQNTDYITNEFTKFQKEDEKLNNKLKEDEEILRDKQRILGIQDFDNEHYTDKSPPFLHGNFGSKQKDNEEYDKMEPLGINKLLAHHDSVQDEIKRLEHEDRLPIGTSLHPGKMQGNALLMNHEITHKFVDPQELKAINEKTARQRPHNVPDPVNKEIKKLEEEDKKRPKISFADKEEKEIQALQDKNKELNGESDILEETLKKMEEQDKERQEEEKERQEKAQEEREEKAKKLEEEEKEKEEKEREKEEKQEKEEKEEKERKEEEKEKQEEKEKEWEKEEKERKKEEEEKKEEEKEKQEEKEKEWEKEEKERKKEEEERKEEEEEQKEKEEKEKEKKEKEREEEEKEREEEEEERKEKEEKEREKKEKEREEEEKEREEEEEERKEKEEKERKKKEKEGEEGEKEREEEEEEQREKEEKERKKKEKEREEEEKEREEEEEERKEKEEKERKKKEKEREEEEKEREEEEEERKEKEEKERKKKEKEREEEEKEREEEEKEKEKKKEKPEMDIEKLIKDLQKGDEKKGEGKEGEGKEGGEKEEKEEEKPWWKKADEKDEKGKDEKKPWWEKDEKGKEGKEKEGEEKEGKEKEPEEKEKEEEEEKEEKEKGEGKKKKGKKEEKEEEEEEEKKPWWEKLEEKKKEQEEKEKEKKPEEEETEKLMKDLEKDDKKEPEEVDEVKKPFWEKEKKEEEKEEPEEKEKEEKEEPEEEEEEEEEHEKPKKKKKKKKKKEKEEKEEPEEEEEEEEEEPEEEEKEHEKKKKKKKKKKKEKEEEPEEEEEEEEEEEPEEGEEKEDEPKKKKKKKKKEKEEDEKEKEEEEEEEEKEKEGKDKDGKLIHGHVVKCKEPKEDGEDMDLYIRKGCHTFQQIGKGMDDVVKIGMFKDTLVDSAEKTSTIEHEDFDKASNAKIRFPPIEGMTGRSRSKVIEQNQTGKPITPIQKTAPKIFIQIVNNTDKFFGPGPNVAPMLHRRANITLDLYDKTNTMSSFLKSKHQRKRKSTKNEIKSNGLSKTHLNRTFLVKKKMKIKKNVSKQNKKKIKLDSKVKLRKNKQNSSLNQFRKVFKKIDKQEAKWKKADGESNEKEIGSKKSNTNNELKFRDQEEGSITHQFAKLGTEEDNYGDIGTGTQDNKNEDEERLLNQKQKIFDDMKLNNAFDKNVDNDPFQGNRYNGEVAIDGIEYNNAGKNHENKEDLKTNHHSMLHNHSDPDMETEHHISPNFAPKNYKDDDTVKSELDRLNKEDRHPFDTLGRESTERENENRQESYHTPQENQAQNDEEGNADAKSKCTKQKDDGAQFGEETNLYVKKGCHKFEQIGTHTQDIIAIGKPELYPIGDTEKKSRLLEDMGGNNSSEVLGNSTDKGVKQNITTENTSLAFTKNDTERPIASFPDSFSDIVQSDDGLERDLKLNESNELKNSSSFAEITKALNLSDSTLNMIKTDSFPDAAQSDGLEKDLTSKDSESTDLKNSSGLAESTKALNISDSTLNILKTIDLTNADFDPTNETNRSDITPDRKKIESKKGDGYQYHLVKDSKGKLTNVKLNLKLDGDDDFENPFEDSGGDLGKNIYFKSSGPKFKYKFGKGKPFNMKDFYKKYNSKGFYNSDYDPFNSSTWGKYKNKSPFNKTAYQQYSKNLEKYLKAKFDKSDPDKEDKEEKEKKLKEKLKKEEEKVKPKIPVMKDPPGEKVAETGLAPEPKNDKQYSPEEDAEEAKEKLKEKGEKVKEGKAAKGDKGLTLHKQTTGILGKDGDGADFLSEVQNNIDANQESTPPTTNAAQPPAQVPQAQTPLVQTPVQQEVVPSTSTSTQAAPQAIPYDAPEPVPQANAAQNEAPLPSQENDDDDIPDIDNMAIVEKNEEQEVTEPKNNEKVAKEEAPTPPEQGSKLTAPAQSQTQNNEEKNDESSSRHPKSPPAHDSLLANIIDNRPTAPYSKVQDALVSDEKHYKNCTGEETNTNIKKDEKDVLVVLEPKTEKAGYADNDKNDEPIIVMNGEGRTPCQNDANNAPVKPTTPQATLASSGSLSDLESLMPEPPKGDVKQCHDCEQQSGDNRSRLKRYKHLNVTKKRHRHVHSPTQRSRRH